MITLTSLAFVTNVLLAQEIAVKESGEGLNHRISIEVEDAFRIVLEAGKNYGITQWFDLSGDPGAKTNLLKNPTDYIPSHEQGALFNQCLNPHDLIAHVASAGMQHKEIPRSIRIFERGPKRVVLENSYSPMLGRVNRNLIFKTHYTILPNGQIHIRNTISSMTSQKITMWRNAIVTLGDPTFHTKSRKNLACELSGANRLRVPNAQWKRNEWIGHVATQSGWRSYDIVSNTHDTLSVKPRDPGKKPDSGKLSIASSRTEYGWKRCDSITQPVGWHRKPAEFLYAYWDPKTPQPFHDWTSASIMLVPTPGNPNQGHGGQLHGWRGCKRLYYEHGELELSAGDSVTQRYLIQLGSKSSRILPNLADLNTCRKIAQKYRTQEQVPRSD